jgi:hypothetical protein
MYGDLKVPHDSVKHDFYSFFYLHSPFGRLTTSYPQFWAVLVLIFGWVAA